MTDSEPEHKPAIIIAAGGAGARIGGDKPLKRLAGRTLIEHAVSWAKSQSDAVAIAVQSPSQVPQVDLPILLDDQPGLGPIAALHSAFRFAGSAGRSHVVMIGCDQPFLPRDLVEQLARAIGTHSAAMPVSAGQAQPLASLWRIDEAALAGYIVAGRRSIWGYAETAGMISLDWPVSPGHDPFANINDPASLDRAQRRVDEWPQ